MSHPSIFNDVLGPVMRGPSSSHTAASWRIGMLAVSLLGEKLAEARVEFDEHGAWAPNYEEQGTVLGMDGGLLGIDIADERVLEVNQIAKEAGISITYHIANFPTDHANTVRLTLTSISGKRLVLVAVSIGGGMFETRLLNGHRFHTQGDYYEMVGYTEPLNQDQKAQITSVVGSTVRWSDSSTTSLFHVQSPKPFAHDLTERLGGLDAVGAMEYSDPILPIVSGNEKDLPFYSYLQTVEFNLDAHKPLGELGHLYEARRSGLSDTEVTAQMERVVGIIERSISTGLAGTYYEDRILQQQSHLIEEAAKKKVLPADDLVKRIIENITAIMEAKSAMKVIVAAPTAGGCGALGGVMKAVADAREISHERKVRAYFAAGLIGVYFAQGPGFSAETGGCQLETGAAAAMAAAALTDMCDGTASQALAAASMALQNTIGLVCDPVADRVEVPCLGKNITAGVNALAASTMALSGFNHVIPLDEVIETVKQVASTMPASLCCTGLGGLAATETSAQIKSQLQKGCMNC
ncbi:MAG: L-serine ammonia-lyase, iron-sulfur-dependent, subunit alpha [Rhodothermales bacterium]|nr:L-serine ammonia-lyase, iron-sulfur-dependent, subunit alpha [Rhodothermales bacterium]MDG2017035.1 L-serine ammonia-lyase, iron-sulfur-dependent, subunit alpha [Rhodothermales bacterium]